jgi:hypothetical protein
MRCPGRLEAEVCFRRATPSAEHVMRARTPAHAGRRVPLDLARGANEVVVRVRGGVYASGGFFARVMPGGER